jgi:hypothetical protein
MQLIRIVIVSALAGVCLAGAQTLPLAHRQTNAPAGSNFIQQVSLLPLAEREQAIATEILSGNVPGCLRRLSSVNLTNVSGGQTNSVTFFVAPEYLAVGSDDDYFLTPLTAATANRVANELDCTLPTRKMVDAIYSAATVKLAPTPIPPSAAMSTVPVFVIHNEIVRTQRVATLQSFPPGALVAGHKKDVVISARLDESPGKVAIYGWQQTNGTPLQPLYLGHTAAWVDYSHGIRLVQQRIIVNGKTTTVARVLTDPRLADLLSDEGTFVNPGYPSNASSTTTVPGNSSAQNIGEFKPTGQFGERVAAIPFVPEVKVQINAPAVADFAPDRPVLLILYALPNGNTTEQTVGKMIHPGDDWHFDIQHIGAQTRFLRALLTNRTIVVAYLETEMKSWPAWRRKHGDSAIPRIVDSLKSIFPTNQLEVVLTGHSGGGSFTFGYLNRQEKIPDDVRRIAFLDSNYAYETTNHLAKLTTWLKSAPQPALGVIAYHDSIALLEGKTFVSERGGTWGRSHAMLADLGAQFPFTSQTNAAGLQTHSALNGRLQFLLKENPDQKILHTVQVERNGFIHAMLMGTRLAGQGYEYFGRRAYADWIQTE